MVSIFDPELTNRIKFEFEEFVANQVGLDIYNINKNFTTGGVCKFHIRGNCTKGDFCPHKHANLTKAVVCKHWLRGLCKKGDQCEFLHEYNLKKMPECWFFTKFNECCNGDECIYLHIDPNSKIKECLWYARGYCKHGPSCRNKHVRKMVCPLYLTGFCPAGPDCENGHPKYELPPVHSKDNDNNQTEEYIFQNDNLNRQYRNTQEVTCYKCGELGHYATFCPIEKAAERESECENIVLFNFSDPNDVIRTLAFETTMPYTLWKDDDPYRASILISAAQHINGFVDVGSDILSGEWKNGILLHTKHLLESKDGLESVVNRANSIVRQAFLKQSGIGEQFTLLTIVWNSFNLRHRAIEKGVQVPWKNENWSKTMEPRIIVAWAHLLKV